LVPLRSPRETKAALGAAIALSAATASCVPTMCAGSDSGPTKIFVPRNLPAVDAVAVVDEFLFGLGIMNENKIGIAPARGIEGLARAEREHVNGHASCLGKKPGRIAANRPELSTEVVDV
jgi:hypothetical protein